MATKPITKDADFNTKLLSIIMCLFGTNTRNTTPPTTLPTASTRLNISSAYMTLLWDLFMEWTDFYPASQAPATQGTLMTNKKNTTRTNWEKTWSLVVNDMTKSALTEDDRIALYLPKRDEVPTETLPKENAPILSFEPSIHGVHVIRISNPDDPNSHAMPKGQKVFLEKFVGEPNLPESQISFGNPDIVTEAIVEIKHQPADVGKVAYYRPCYITTTGKKGVTGVVISAVIS